MTILEPTKSIKGIGSGDVACLKVHIIMKILIPNYDLNTHLLFYLVVESDDNP